MEKEKNIKKFKIYFEGEYSNEKNWMEKYMNMIEILYTN